ncbi:Plasma membrane, myosin-like, Tubulin/FtsZ, N-terminal isoform 6 [Hibiscus syriacus]|uniref:Plasma membrane, myosin-like, Tubulin/FtsZ, N-terminal isoform 6 n=1 Tax=Hibiscus syriacus TaxID=106335 RepID=A0A6A2WNF1_HIBSY|nr:Plasma membrane, myosin-like, Tubulin/FtsZ, N-terminal isoform 6 [Hibiscus syriacus]
MREIVTVQVGGFANYIGSHFWNFQDEMLGLAADPYASPLFKTKSLNMDVLYRTGETHQGTITYTPRLLSIDFQGSLGSVSSKGTFYSEDSNASSEVVTWVGNVSTHASEPQKRNLFLQSLYQEEQDAPLMNGIHDGEKASQNEIQDTDIVSCLDKGVQFWTDFSKVHYHPQSLYEINGLWMDAQEFDNYGSGKDVFMENLRGEEICERLRFFTEECDHVQGFQFIVDDSGGFSPLAADFLETVSDDYTNTPVLLYAVRGPNSHMNLSSRKQKVVRDLHDAVSFTRLSSFCKLIVPVGLPFLSRSKASTFLNIKAESPYHCSAVYAAALHSTSLPFRMEALGPTADSSDVCGAVDVNGIVQMLAGQSRQNMVAIMDVEMPGPSLTGRQNEQSLLANLQTLTPEVAEDVDDWQAVESMIVHGATGPGGCTASVSEIKNAIHGVYGCATSKPMFCHLSVQHQEDHLMFNSIPMAARMRSTSAIMPFLENRLGNLRKFGIERGCPGAELLRSWGFGKDEVEDIGETLSNMVRIVNPYSEMSSDSD